MSLTLNFNLQIGFKHLLSAFALLLVSDFAVRAAEPPQPSGTPLEVTAKLVDCPIAGVTCIRLSAVNLSPLQSVIVQGDKALLVSNSGNTLAANPRAVYKMLNKKNLDKKREAQVAATIATAGLGTMIVSDAIDKGSGSQEWLGDEAKRRQSSDKLFDERIVLPLDHTDGLLYFVCAGDTSRLRIATKLWPPEDGVSPEAFQSFEIPVQARQ